MIKRGRYMEAYADRVVSNSYRNHVLAEMVREGYRRGYYVILLLKRLKHMKFVSRRLQDVPHRIVAGVDYKGEKLVLDKKSGKMVRKVIGDKIEVSQRRTITKHFEAGEVRVILANQVFEKGVNIKRVDVIIDGAASKSKNECVQKFGRGIRLHPEKGGLLYFDLADQSVEGNWFSRAAKSRKRAFAQAGLTVRDFDWEKMGEVRELYDRAEKWLKLELKRR